MGIYSNLINLWVSMIKNTKAYRNLKTSLAHFYKSLWNSKFWFNFINMNMDLTLRFEVVKYMLYLISIILICIAWQDIKYNFFTTRLNVLIMVCLVQFITTLFIMYTYFTRSSITLHSHRFNENYVFQVDDSGDQSKLIMYKQFARGPDATFTSYDIKQN